MARVPDAHMEFVVGGAMRRRVLRGSDHRDGLGDRRDLLRRRKLRRERRDLFWLALAIGLYVPLQAIIGGITVLTNLNPYVVGLHYFASVVLVALAAVLANPWADVVLSGAVTPAQLTSNLAALRVELDPGELAELAALAEPPERYWEERAGLSWS